MTMTIAPPQNAEATNTGAPQTKSPRRPKISTALPGPKGRTIIEADEILPKLDVVATLQLIFHTVSSHLRPKPRRPLATPVSGAMVPNVDAESDRSPR